MYEQNVEPGYAKMNDTPRIIAGSTSVDRACDRLAKQLALLTERLNAVLQPQQDGMPAADSLTAVAVPRSPLAGDLERYASRVEQYADEIGNILQRLEV